MDENKNLTDIRNAFHTIVSNMSEEELLRTGYHLIASKQFLAIGYGSGLHVTFGDGNITQNEGSFEFTLECNVPSLGDETEKSFDNKVEGRDFIAAFLQQIMSVASVRTRIKLLLAAGYGSSTFNPISEDDPVDFDIHINGEPEAEKEIEKIKADGVTMADLFREMWHEICVMRDSGDTTYNPYTYGISNNLANLVKEPLNLTTSEVTFAAHILPAIVSYSENKKDSDHKEA